MNFIDLFAGIGGFRLGMEKAGHKCLAYCEIDKFARKTYEANFDTMGETKWTDITKVTDEEIEEFGKQNRVDVICGGFPCQPFSIAGKRKGYEDTRGTLFFEIMRFAKILKPKHLFLENVKGILSNGGGTTFTRILQTLDAVGYDCEWQLLNSKDFGVPQNRERVFIIGHLRGKRTRQIFPLAANAGENPCKLQELTTKSKQGMRVYSPSGLSVTLSSQGGGLGAKTGLYGFIDLTKNGAKITQNARTLQARYDKGVTNRKGETSGVAVYPVLTPDRVNKRQNGRRFKDDGEPMFTLTAQDRHGIAIQKENIRIRKLTPLECFRLQGFPDKHYYNARAVGLSDTQLYKQAGNAVTVPVIYEIAKNFKIEGD